MKCNTQVKKVGYNSFWHLLMNLKNKYLLEKLLKWANKKQNNFNIYNSALKKRKEETKALADIIILHLCTKSLDDIIYSS